jgi:hypothetical protein
MKVEIEGILGKEFGDAETHFSDYRDVIKELCRKVRGFKDRVIALSKEGLEYTIVKTDEGFSILPVLFGSGGLFSWIAVALGVALICVGVGAIIASTSVWGITAGTWLTVGAALLAVGLAKPASSKAVDTSSPTSANSSSNNLTGETPDPNGTPIPIGFGMLLVSPVAVFQCLESIRGNVDATTYLNTDGR